MKIHLFAKRHSLRRRRSRLFAVALCISALVGCSAPPTLKQQNWPSIASAQNIEIFYNKEDHAIHYGASERTGQGLMSVGALLGPIGLVAAAASHYSMVKSGVDATTERSQSFNAAARPLAAAGDMGDEFARQLADELQKSGKVVKLTAIKRLPGKLPGETVTAVPPVDVTCAGGVCGTPGMLRPASAVAPTVAGASAPGPLAGNGYIPTAGYTPLLLRLTTSYIAADIYSDYRPMAVVEAALVSTSDSRYLTYQTLTGGLTDAKKYPTWDALKADVPGARAQLRQALLAQAPQVKKALFEKEAGL